jgi:ribosomal-protein-alanine N-acetyltransferase
MSAILSSERLTLTPLASGDVDMAVEMFTNPAVMKFVGGVMSEADVRRRMSVWTRRGGDGCIGIWCISDGVTGEKYGSGVLLPMPVDDDDTDWTRVIPGAMPEEDVEVGYILKETAWGRGYATEVCRRLLRFAFEATPLAEIVATFDDGHEASRRVLEKSGLSCRGRRRAYGKDSPDWRISRSEWEAAVRR